MKRKKRLWYAGVGLLSASLVSLLYLQFVVSPSSVATREATTRLYPTQYSDAHITRNAIVSDERFSSSETFKKESFVASVVHSLRTEPKTLAVLPPERGTWLWTPTLAITPAYRNEVIAGAKKNDITVIYISLDSYLDIYVMPDGPEKALKRQAFDTILQQFIVTANKNGIAVDAEAGWRNWAEPGNEYKAFAILEYVREFNATHTEQFRGFQYDIEPYVLSSYATDKKTVLRNFIDLIYKTVTRLNDSDLAFSVVIPEFYDGANGETPRFLYGLNYTYTFTHLLKVLERRPGSTLIIMAYRNKSTGHDGSIVVSEDEVREANDYRARVIIAQETGDVEPPFITFHNTSLGALNTEIQHIENAFADHQSYHGIAIHYINALMNLKE
jgi:hypothetical protein